MDSLVFAAVLFAAACHAGWNAAIKIGSDTLSATALISVGAGIFGAALLPFVGLPLAAAWPWVIASLVIHLFYFIGLSEGYRVGDLGQVYPLARGAAPLMTASLSVPLVGEALGPLGWGAFLRSPAVSSCCPPVADARLHAFMRMQQDLPCSLR